MRETGEFCFNVVTEPVWRKMVDSANAFPASDSEFAKTGLTPIPSVKIAAPRVKEVPIHFECKLERVLESARTGILWSSAKWFTCMLTHPA